MRVLVLILVVAVATGVAACRSRDASTTPDAWIDIVQGAPPSCFVRIEEHEVGIEVPCADIGQYLTTNGLPQGAKARIAAYSSNGIAWPEVRVVIESLTAAGYLNAGILTPKVGFVKE